MKREKKFSKPFDLAHSIMFNQLEGEYTAALGAPGIFVEKINRRVRLKDGTGGEMDSAYIANPDNKILFERAAVALEHQSIPVGTIKKDKICDYDVQLVVDHHLPTLILIASHLIDKNSIKEIVRTPSDITRLYFLDLGEENITQRLSTVREIINSNQEVSRETALNLGIIVIYAPRDKAREITEEVVGLYLKIVDVLDSDMEYTLYSVITIVIDAYFDDENEYRRLINMMDGKTSVESKELTASHLSTVESLQWAKEDLDETKNQLDATKDQLDETKGQLDETKDQLDETKGQLDETKDQLDETKTQLNTANDRISTLEAEVQMLKEKLTKK